MPSAVRHHTALLFATLTVTACRPSAPLPPPTPPVAAEEAAREAIAREQALNVDSIPKGTIGVPPFHVDVRDTILEPLSYGLADLLMTDLARSKELRVVDRLQLDALLRELDLAEAGRVDSLAAPRVGKLVGARHLVLGSLSQPLGDERRNDRLYIDMRIADVPFSELQNPVSTQAPLADILDAEKELAFRLFNQLGVTLTDAERDSVEQRPTNDIAALLAYSRAVRFEALGLFKEAQAEYEEAVRVDPNFTLARTRLASLQMWSASPGEVDLREVRAQSEQHLGQAMDWAANGVNPPSVSTITPRGTEPARAAGPGDAPYSSGRTITVIITITTPPSP